MIIKIEIDDFYLDSEQDFVPALKNEVVREAVKQSLDNVAEKANKAVQEAVKLAVEKKLQTAIQKVVDKVVATGTLLDPSSYSNEKRQISIEDYVIRTFEKNTGWNSPKEQIEKLAKKYGDEMKARYDMEFASKIVIQMSQNGLVRADVLQSLLTPPKD